MAKYGEGWRFDAHDGEFHHTGDGGVAQVYEVAPVPAFGFRKGEYGRPRWRFA